MFQCSSLHSEEIRKERKKSTKHDSLVRVASLLNEAGRQGVEAQWEQTDEFHDLWKVKGREFLAKTEWKRRKTVKRVRSHRMSRFTGMQSHNLLPIMYV